MTKGLDAEVLSRSAGPRWLWSGELTSWWPALGTTWSAMMFSGSQVEAVGLSGLRVWILVSELPCLSRGLRQVTLVSELWFSCL